MSIACTELLVTLRSVFRDGNDTCLMMFYVQQFTRAPAPTQTVMLIIMYVNLLILLRLFVNITLHLLCNWLGDIFHFETVVNTGLHLVSRLRMSGAVSLITRIHSLCSAVQVTLPHYLSHTHYVGIILLYLLCTMFNF